MKKELEHYFRDEQNRRVEIMQDSDDLEEEYAHRLNYDHTDPVFLKYFTSRTGHVETPEYAPDPMDTDVSYCTLIAQCRLQDCWDIFKQPGIREEFLIKMLIKEGKRGPGVAIHGQFFRSSDLL